MLAGHKTAAQLPSVVPSTKFAKKIKNEKSVNRSNWSSTSPETVE
jgi:hypothetical protein